MTGKSPPEAGASLPLSLHSNPDASAWARAFVEMLPHFVGPIDEALMTGWFANAMMAMHDSTMRQLEDDKVDRQ